jgi:hypothetical protein
MRPPRPLVTVERLMVPLAILVAGTLVIGSISGISSEVAQVDAVIFGAALGAEIAFALILAVRWLRHSPRTQLRPTLAVIVIVMIIAWAAVEWPFVENWSRYAGWENFYRHDPEAEVNRRERAAQIAMCARLRRAYQDGMWRPWKTVDPR